MINDKKKRIITQQIVVAFAICIMMTVLLIYAFARRDLAAFSVVTIVNISACVVTAFFATVLFASGLFDDYDIYTEEFIGLSRLMFFEVCALFYDGMSTILMGMPKYFTLCNVFRAAAYSQTAVMLFLTYKLIRAVLGLEGKKYDLFESFCVITVALETAANFLDLKYHILFSIDPVNCTYEETQYYNWLIVPVVIIILFNIYFSLKSKQRDEKRTAVRIMAFIPLLEMFTFLLSDELDILFPLFFIGVLTAFVCIYSGRKAELELKNSDIQFASNVQKRLLPRTAVTGKENPYEIFGMTETAEAVSGDFYDYYATDGESVCFSVGDVCGEGIPSALFMMQTSSAIRNFAFSGYSCSEVFGRTNNLLEEHNELGYFVMCWYGCLDLRTGAVKFSNAGHRPPLIVRNDGKVEIASFRPNIPLAVQVGTEYKCNEFALSPGDTLVLYTDGIVEATDKARKMFGMQRLIAAAEHEKGDVVSICRNILSEARAYSYDLSREEDMTVLAIRFNGFGGADI